MTPYVILFLAILIALLAMLSFHQQVDMSECKNNQTLLAITMLQVITVLTIIYYTQVPDIRAIMFVTFVN